MYLTRTRACRVIRGVVFVIFTRLRCHWRDGLRVLLEPGTISLVVPRRDNALDLPLVAQSPSYQTALAWKRVGRRVTA
jgi:hypothetical protein